jgi:hypothetical protein
VAEYQWKAKQHVEGLIEGLDTILQRDPDQEVGGMALPVLDAVVEAIKDDIGRDNPVVKAVAGVISPETIEAWEPIRTADALIVAKMLDAEIGRRPPVF